MPKFDVPKIAQDMAAVFEGWSVWLNTETGETREVCEDPSTFCDDEEEPEELEEPLWRRLPDKFEIHEWAIMRDFAASRDDPEARAALLEAVHGRGAFRVFRQTTERLGIREAWFAYLQEAAEAIVREFLEVQQLPLE